MAAVLRYLNALGRFGTTAFLVSVRGHGGGGDAAHGAW